MLKNILSKKNMIFMCILRICHFKELLLNTTEKFCLLAQAFTKIYTLHLQGKEFRKRQKNTCS